MHAERSDEQSRSKRRQGAGGYYEFGAGASISADGVGGRLTEPSTKENKVYVATMPDGTKKVIPRAQAERAIKKGAKYEGEVYYDSSRVGCCGGDQQSNGGTDFSLANLYLHFQVGGGKPLNINMSSVDFSGTSQKELGLTGMKSGDVRPVNLFNAGPLNQAALAFGRVNIKAHGNNQFSIIGGDESSQFNFSPLIDSDASFGRNAGNLLGAGINYNVFPSLILRSPIPTLVPLIFGGPFDIHFNGTTTIPK
jgi:hypothetical protein